MRIFLLLMVGIWIGLVLGLSFVEAPLKFQAPGITTKLGLGIGRLVFGVSNKIQLVCLAILVFSAIVDMSSFNRVAQIMTMGIVAILSIQTFYLLPALDARAQLILADQVVPASRHHLLFVGLEISKLILLFVIFKNLCKQWLI